MSHDTDVRTPESREDGTRNRGPLTWLVAAAAVLLILGVGAFGLLNRDQGRNEVPGAATQPTVTELQGPGSQARNARCRVPTAEILSHQTTAVDATVRSITDDVVVLVPSHWYAGGPTDRVEVRAPASDLQG